jgi:hypothetical protein
VRLSRIFLDKDGDEWGMDGLAGGHQKASWWTGLAGMNGIAGLGLLGWRGGN